MPNMPPEVWAEINSFFLVFFFYLEYLSTETRQVMNMVREVNEPYLCLKVPAKVSVVLQTDSNRKSPDRKPEGLGLTMSHLDKGFSSL